MGRGPFEQAHRQEQQEVEQQQRVRQVAGEVKEPLQLGRPGERGAQERPRRLLRGLDAALRPAGLLLLERAHLDRQFSGDDGVVQVAQPPAAQLGAVREVQVFG